MDLSTLNEDQHEAVTYNDGDLVVLSSAGSGKTRVLTTKIAYLMDVLEVRPSRIFAVTFTKNAAEEMKERIVDIVGETAEFVKMSTIHSLAYRIWRQGKNLKEPWIQLPTPLVHEGKALGHLYKYLGANKFMSKDAKAFLDDIGVLKMNLVKPEDLKKEIENNYGGEQVPWHNPSSLPYQHAKYLVYKEYETWKAKRNYIDFNDMLVYCHDMLTNPSYSDYVATVQRTCDYLLVDECQDTNLVAFKIFNIIAKGAKAITMVGDTRQAIYSFQNARVQNIHDFIAQRKPKIVNLRINYRSTKKIVENANEVIQYSKEAIGEPAITPNESGQDITLYRNTDHVSEGSFLFDEIKNLHEIDGVPWKDITILYRIHSQSRELEDWFLLNEIPYISYAKTTFYKRKEIQDLMAYLKIGLTPENGKFADFKRIANKPTRYLSNKALEKIEDIADDLDISMYEAMGDVWNHNLPQNEAEKIDMLYSDLRKLRKYVTTADPEIDKDTQNIFKFILEKIGYEKWAIEDRKNKSDVDDDIEMNFESLLASVAKFPEPEGFLSFISDLKKKEKLEKDPNGDFVKLMSVHRSKGKEFKHVFVLGLCDRIFPFHRAVMEGNEDEERRIMYVAVTRPQEKLYLSTIVENYGRFKVSESPYIQQMKTEHFKVLNNFTTISPPTE